jgi:hypothetical protein
MSEQDKTTADRLEQALRDLEASKKAAAELAAQHAPKLERLSALESQLQALPQHERRRVLDAAGLKHLSAAPPPITPVRGGTVAPSPTAQAPKAIKWGLWRNLPHVKLWEAVALALDIDPRSLREERDNSWEGGGAGPVFNPRSFPSRDKHSAFDEWLDAAVTAANYEGPIFLRIGLASGMNKRTAEVSLREVVAFLVECGLEGIPAPLLAAANPAVPVLDDATENAQPLVLNAGAPTAPAKIAVVGDRGRMIKREVLVSENVARWRTIERDIQDASTNGLSEAAKAEKFGFWYEADAIKWAEARGKYVRSQGVPGGFASVFHRMGN